jgi:hypothetical protein
MKKQFFSSTLIIAVLILTGFKLKTNELWTATLKLEGKEKSYTLVSDAVYGGFNPGVHKFFLFGKNHMFQCKEDAAATKAFLDLCSMNGSGQFELQLSGIQNPVPSSKTLPATGKLNFLKKGASANASFRYIKEKGKEISLEGNFAQFGLTLDPETAKTLTGNFSLKFTSNQ